LLKQYNDQETELQNWKVRHLLKPLQRQRADNNTEKEQYSDCTAIDIKSRDQHRRNGV